PRAAPRVGAAVLAAGLAVVGGVTLGVGGDALPASAAPPVVTFPAPGETVPGNEFTATGTSDEPFDITIRMNADLTDRCVIPFEAGTWSWECDVTGLSGGAQELHVIQNGIDTVVNFTLEGTPLSVVSPPDGGIVYDT